MQPNRDSVSTAQPQLKSVPATSVGLIKATLGAAAMAVAILVFVVLPAEYGIDPTGLGKKLGLTEMGHIKEQLHTQADADAVELSAQPNSEVLRRLNTMQAQLDTIAVAVDTLTSTTSGQASAQVKSDSPSTVWRDEFEYTLSPGEGIEVKLVMDEGAIALYEWNANGSVLNHDTHGDGNGQNISYEQGRSIPRNSGTLTAAFTGNHGWFWRNRTKEGVVVTLRTRGDYKNMLLP